jgi:hypothetical protein
MIDNILLEIPDTIFAAVKAHLLPNRFIHEEAAFMFVRQQTKSKDKVFVYLDWFAVPEKGFLSRSGFHFELTDEIRARAIKHAHDLDASLVEFHSHKRCRSAGFSVSDLFGFQEFVPHVWWRLKGRPYFAVVVSRYGFDGLVWIIDANTPQYLDGIIVGRSVLTPTRLTPLKYNYYDRRTI